MKRDQTPYYVFACTKCKRYLYARTTQKAKKCFACGRIHRVENIADLTETVNGMTAATNRVRERQNQLAVKELGSDPDLKAFNEFRVAGNSSKKEAKKPKKGIDEEELAEENFQSLLNELSGKFETFPRYMVELMANDFGVPENLITFLIRKFINDKKLITMKNNYFKVN